MMFCSQPDQCKPPCYFKSGKCELVIAQEIADKSDDNAKQLVSSSKQCSINCRSTQTFGT